ncbi:MAG: OmpH family outer membrane protein [Prevotella sp.]|nr:OmpH family outer membrane protein [Candidatus Equicola faecalis]MDO4819373.1 OmpH family outer membrane protein [Prevotella sp.]
MKKLLLIALLCAPMSVFAQKFGHVNSQDVIQAMPEYTAARTEIENLTKQYEADLKSMQDELQKKSENFDKEAASLPDATKTRRQQELTDLYQKIQQAYQDNQADIQKKSSEKMQAIMQKVNDAIQAIGKAGAYVYIVDVASGLPYISETLSNDITADVKAKLGLK